ncbi:MAG TPA: SDR family NAD(P)-dependent oxidoreductase [Rectinemataceae bacterium]|nr:SDR family NAD(P)-dependent oxidoreductase [Rectinemataceae bacterium]
MEIKDSVFVVTGAGSGIGEAVAKHFASRGAAVALGDLSVDSVNRVVAEIEEAGGRALGAEVDVTKDESVSALMDRTVSAFGRINGVVPCAGIIKDSLLVNIDKESGHVKKAMESSAFRAVIEVNLVGSFITIREAARRMVDGGWKGVLFTISSVNKAGQIGQLNYSSSKAALAVWPRIIAGELHMKGVSGIRCVGIAPGYVGTAMVKGMNQDALAAIVGDVHIGRLIEPEEIALCIGSVVENEAIDGTCLEITGGLTFGPRSIAR